VCNAILNLFINLLIVIAGDANYVRPMRSSVAEDDQGSSYRGLWWCILNWQITLMNVNANVNIAVAEMPSSLNLCQEMLAYEL